MSSSTGKKVTTDTEAKEHPIEEPTGILLSDSLAAESLQSSGSFAANQSKKGISDQPSRGTTANNTDVSSAQVLPPAPFIEARSAKEDNSDEVLNEGIGLGKYAGRGPTYNIPARNQSDGQWNNQSDDQSSSQVASDNDSANKQDQVDSGSSKSDRAPTYVQVDVERKLMDDNMKPKGNNIQEGGFDANTPNTSFNSDVGDRNDPARLAERQYQKRNMQSSADAGAGPRQRHLEVGGGYAALHEEQA